MEEIKHRDKIIVAHSVGFSHEIWSSLAFFAVCLSVPFPCYVCFLSLSLSPLLNYSKVLFARQDQTTLDKKRFLLFICGLRMVSPLPKPDDVF
jgi:hypothetical protein